VLYLHTGPVYQRLRGRFGLRSLFFVAFVERPQHTKEIRSLLGLRSLFRVAIAHTGRRTPKTEGSVRVKLFVSCCI
jgi:hypothetical protein